MGVKPEATFHTHSGLTGVISLKYRRILTCTLHIESIIYSYLMIHDVKKLVVSDSICVQIYNSWFATLQNRLSQSVKSQSNLLVVVKQGDFAFIWCIRLLAIVYLYCPSVRFVRRSERAQQDKKYW